MLDFLSQVVLVQDVEQPLLPSGERKIERNPTNGAALRLFKDGRIYPSLALVEQFNLQYTAKGIPQNNGFDIWSTQNWGSWPNPAPGHCIWIAAVNKALPKVSLFGMTKYNADNQPTSRVEDQAPKTFGLELIQMLADTYGFSFGENQGWVDLGVVYDADKVKDAAIVHIPKVIKKGLEENKGKIEHIRRENITMYPLVIFTPTEPQTPISTFVDIISE